MFNIITGKKTKQKQSDDIVLPSSQVKNYFPKKGNKK